MFTLPVLERPEIPCLYLTAVGTALNACTNCSFYSLRLHSKENVVDGKVTLYMCLARATTLTDIGAWPREIEKCSRTVLQTVLLVPIF